MNLTQYIQAKYKGNKFWFAEVVKEPENLNKYNDVVDKKEYLNGYHAILTKPLEEYKGKEYKPSMVMLQYAKLLVSFQTSYLLMNPVTYTGEEDVIKQINMINRKGKYDRLNMKLLSNMLKYGESYEYVYMNGDKISSKIIDTANGFPMYNHYGELIGFIEHFINDGISYYNVYDKYYVSQYDNAGGKLQMRGYNKSLSGLPIIYKTNNELDGTRGRSELDDWISKLDEMEELISKFHDTTYKMMNPIPIITGQQLQDSLNPKIVGHGLVLDEGSSFEFANVKLDIETFKELYGTLMSDLLNISSTPAVAMNKTNVANLSSESISMMYTLSEIKAKENEMYMRDGLEERLNKFRELLKLKGVNFDDETFESVNMKFKYNTPFNTGEMLDDMVKQHKMGALSVQSIIEQSPYTLDVSQELERLNVTGEVNGVVNENKEVEDDDEEVLGE